MQKLLRLAVGAAVAWTGASLYLSGGQSFLLAPSAVPDLWKAIVAIAGLQLAQWVGPVITVCSVSSANGSTSPLSAVPFIRNLLVVAAPAFAAMTAVETVQSGPSSRQIGIAVAGLAAMTALLYQRRRVTGLASDASSPSVESRQSAEARASVRQSLSLIGHAEPDPEGAIEVRYVTRSGVPQSVTLGDRRARPTA